MNNRSILFILGILFTFSAIAAEIKEFDLFAAFNFNKYIQTKSEIYVDEFYHTYEMGIININQELIETGKAKLLFHTDDGDKTFVITRLLSARAPGNTTYVFELDDGERALRLPRFINDTSYRKIDIWKFMQYFVEGYEEMKNQPLNIVDIFDYYAHPSTPPQFIVVKKLDILFDLKQYWEYLAEPEYDKNKIADKLAKNKLDVESINKLLVDELINTWAMMTIGDYHPRQIGFTRDGQWILFDYTSGMLNFTNYDDPTTTVISSLLKYNYQYQEVPKSVLRILDEAISGIVKMRQKAISGEIVMPSGKDIFSNSSVSIKPWCDDSFVQF